MQYVKPFQLLLFHRNLAFSKSYVDAGVDGLIVDFENKGKAARQLGFDLEINAHTLSDLRAVKTLNGAHVMCRINQPGPHSRQEISEVLSAGADEIIVPMIRDLKAARSIVDQIADRAKITLMVETAEALTFASDLDSLPIDRIYVGLNDLHISLKSPTIFHPLIDGTVARLRDDVHNVQFGFGGLTLPGRGSPLPVEHLVDNLALHHADFTFLRRSFYRDAALHSPGHTMELMRDAIQTAQDQKTAQHSQAFDALKNAVQMIGAPADGS